MFVFEKLGNDRYVIKSHERINGRLLKDDDGYFYYWPEFRNEKCWDALTMKVIAKKLDELNKDWDRELNSNFISKIKIIT